MFNFLNYSRLFYFIREIFVLIIITKNDPKSVIDKTWGKFFKYTIFQNTIIYSFHAILPVLLSVDTQCNNNVF